MGSHLREVLRAAKFTETENGPVAARAGGRGSEDFTGRWVSVVEMKRVLEVGYTIMRTYRALLNSTLKMVEMLNFVLCVFCHD